MQVKIRSTLGTGADKGLHEHVQRRLRFSLSRVAEHVRSVHVQLRDVNGPRGGVDKSCTVQIQLTQAPTVLVNDMDYDVLTLIDRVADRASQAALRSLQRRQLRYRTPANRSYLHSTEVSL
jgi:ribosome-associated translation inhibitor RaiA